MQAEPTADGTAGRGDDDETLLLDSARVAQLLEELERAAGPNTWPRIEEVVQLLVGLYGAGLDRLLRHVERAGALDRELEDRLCGDELLASLLLLHGLHPVPTSERVRRAVAAVGRELGLGPSGVDLVELDDEGRARLRLRSAGCASSRASVEELLRSAVEQAAPEVTGIDVVDAGPSLGSDSSLVQIGPRRSAEGSGSTRGGGP